MSSRHRVYTPRGATIEIDIDAERERQERREQLHAARAARPPLPYNVQLQEFHCFCGAILTPNPDQVIPRPLQCGCGRRWLPTEVGK